MKFFTRAWASGELPDEQDAAVPKAYWSYLATLDLPAAVTALSHVNPHDAWLLGVEHEPARARLALRLRCGDLQAGYSDVRITFSGANVSWPALNLLRRSVRPTGVEVQYDEVDRAGDQFEYRLSFWPAGEVSVLFQDVAISKHPVADREAK